MNVIEEGTEPIILADGRRFRPCLNIDPSRQPALNHRSGWAFALEALAPLHDPQGVLFDSFLERSFSWVETAEIRRGRIPYRQPWIGIFHNPPGIPLWHDYRSSPQAIMARDPFQESLPHCLGLFTLSEYLGRWLTQRVDVPICALVHPTEIPEIQFSPEAFQTESRPMVIQIGWWLRRLQSIFNLEANGFRKVMLAVGRKYFDNMLSSDPDANDLSTEALDSVTLIPHVSNAEYDELLSKSIVFCDLIDSSANNVIIECMVRNTPILINRLPAIEEYLGRDYPFYFSSLDEAAGKLGRRETIIAAHEYLKRQPKEQFSQNAFRDAFVRSNVLRSIRDSSRMSHGMKALTRAGKLDQFECNRDLKLVLSRSISGTVYVEQVELRAVGTSKYELDRTLQSMLCGLPLNVVRLLTVQDFERRLVSQNEAKKVFKALKQALGRV